MKKIILLLLIVSGLAFSTAASHIESCDLTIRYMGGNNYEVQLTFYRDCSGVAEPTSVSVHCKSSCNPTGFNVTLNKLPPLNGEHLTPVCPGTLTTCNGGTIFGFERFVYSGIAALPACADWTLSYMLCCRNPSNTIQAPTSASMYIPALLDNSQGMENSSPYFSDIPTAVICNGQPTCIYFGCEDMDGDSLVYSLITPWNTGPGTSVPNVTYIGGYTAQQPLPSSPPVTMNAYTGEVCMTPTANLTTVFAVQVDEYRRVAGAAAYKIGSIIRDIQLTSMSCTNNIPKLAGINPSAIQYDPGDTDFSATICEGIPYSFNVYSNDPDVPDDTLTMTYSNILYGPTWSVTNNNTPNPTGHFSWTPIASDTMNNPHCFFIKIADDNCPYIGYRNFCYCLTVLPFTSNVGLNLPQDSSCDTGPSILLNGGTPPGGIYSGDDVSGSYFIPSAGATGYSIVHYTYTSGSCSKTANDSIYVDECTGINEIKIHDGSFSIFPNPMTDELNICMHKVFGTAKISLKDVFGREVLIDHKYVSGDSEALYDLSELGSGIYILSISTERSTIIRKLIKSR
jgi:hypothetical protein